MVVFKYIECINIFYDSLSFLKLFYVCYALEL
jgi:hypothetical protein